MFKTPGNIDCTVTDAFIAESKFPPKENEINNRNEYVSTWYDVCLLLQDEAGNTDTWHGEMSNRTGQGTRAHMYRSDLTLETLRQIGFNVNTIQELEAQWVTNPDRSISLPNLVGCRCTAVVAASEKLDKEGRPFLNIKYITALGAATGGAKKLTIDEIMKRRGGAAAAPAAAAPTMPPPAPAPAPSAAPNWNPPNMQQAAPPAAPVPPPAPKNPYA